MTFERLTIDGRAIADDLYASLAERRASIAKPVTLGIIVVGVNPVIESFVGIKTRAAQKLDVAVQRVDLPESATTEDVVVAVHQMNGETDALIVQLPLPKQVDTNAVLSEIRPQKDVDAINPRHSSEKPPIEAPVALAVIEILERGNISIPGKRAVVIGGGRLVGAPTAALLKKLGAHVSMFTLDEGSIEDLKDADIVVCGAGQPGMVKPEHVKDGVAIVDAGASEQGGVIRGDADPACAEKAALFTPVPRGVGPVAVAMIFRNLFDLVEKATS